MVEGKKRLRCLIICLWEDKKTGTVPSNVVCQPVDYPLPQALTPHGHLGY